MEYTPVMERQKDVRMPESDGVLGTVKNGFNFVGEKTSDLKNEYKPNIDTKGIKPGENRRGF